MRTSQTPWASYLFGRGGQAGASSTKSAGVAANGSPIGQVRRAAATAVEAMEPRRLMSAGDLDTSFGPTQDGMRTIDFGNSIDEVSAIAVQANGNIIGAGSTGPNYDSLDAAVFRLTPDGLLDESFGNGGKVVIDLLAGQASAVTAVVVQGTKIVVAGVAGSYSGRDFFLARLNTNGTLDTAFGPSGTGVVTLDVTGSDDHINAMVLQGSRILVAGGAANTGGYDVALARFDANGILDPTFGAGGKVLTDTTGSGIKDEGTAVALDPATGAIVVGGSYQGLSSFNPAVIRFGADGARDTAFGGAGGYATRFDTGPVKGVVVGAASKVLVAGDLSFDEAAIARLNADGTWDTSFNAAGPQPGLAKIPFGAGASGNAVALQANGRILVAGSGVGGFATARLMPDGTLDLSFSGDGVSAASLTSFIDFNRRDIARALTVSGDGKIVLVGKTAPVDMGVARFDLTVAPVAAHGGPYSVSEGGSVPLSGLGSTDSDGTVM